MIKEVILVFSTGRSGTALLAQYFGGKLESRFSSNVVGGVAVAHEPFDNSEAYWQAIADRKKGLATNVMALVHDVAGKFETCDKFFITDNKLGRWFWEDFLQAGVKTKIIYLSRNEQDVARSLKRSFPAGLMWGYQPEDKAPSLTDRSADPFWYHIKETSANWGKVRERLHPDQYMEISLERFLSEKKTREAVEKFVGIPGNEHLLIKVNESVPCFGMLGYGKLKNSVSGLILKEISKIRNLLRILKNRMVSYL